MTSNYDRGRRHEDRAVKELRKAGFLAQRIAGSHGVFDVVAINAEAVRLIQVKAQGAATANTRDELRSCVVPPGVSVELWERRRGGWIVEVVNGGKEG
jgi:hypothetical protein